VLTDHKTDHRSGIREAPKEKEEGPPNIDIPASFAVEEFRTVRQLRNQIFNFYWRQFRRDSDKFAFENSFFPSSRDESEPITGSGFSAAVPNHLGK